MKSKQLLCALILSTLSGSIFASDENAPSTYQYDDIYKSCVLYRYQNQPTGTEEEECSCISDYMMTIKKGYNDFKHRTLVRDSLINFAQNRHSNSIIIYQDSPYNEVDSTVRFNTMIDVRDLCLTK